MTGGVVGCNLLVDDEREWVTRQVQRVARPVGHATDAEEWDAVRIGDRVGRIVFELAPQLRQVHPQVERLHGVRRAPHFLEQLFAADETRP